ncbi:uncharacterized protein J7T54_002466 [Emericellopsis cladophorae]|uniref:SUZ domain-containing protein n=1 Tax=Emericellopsis cladophorae TaxID=2686198 RepID=A0A9P9Y2B8_9HYPO|nr:uncharacterized protein J7T54_002466 [Emericellopsis cladophorae]KAI6782229.1 hypothetical protein J7T54_002466 [Emericellopsis cladophorae]
MPKKAPIPDAWDDDWEVQADSIDLRQPTPEPEAEPSNKAERIARHVETNRKLWESADTPDTFHFVEANNTVPLQTGFKPQVQVLSRKPVIAKRDPATGMSNLSLQDEEEDARGQEGQPSPEEVRARQKKELEEKQRRYEEARAKIFGQGPASSSGASSPSGAGTVTPPRADGHGNARARGRGRGGQRGDKRRQNNTNNQTNNVAPTRELFDPGYASKLEQRGADSPQRLSTPRLEQQQQPAIRSPRGPDGSGRGGFGFAQRGAKGN